MSNSIATEDVMDFFFFFYHLVLIFTQVSLARVVLYCRSRI